MKIRFSGETFDLPPPVAAADDILLTVSRFTPVVLPAPEPAESTLSWRNLRKLQFFTLHEGLSLTLAKVRAVLSHRKLGRGRTLVVAVGTNAATGRPALAFGGQDCPDAERLRFPRALVIEDAAADDPDAAAAALLAYCAAHPDRAAAVRDWSPYSGLPPAVTAADALAEGRRLVAAGRAPPRIPTPVAVRFPAETAPAPVAASEAGGTRGLFLAGAGTYPCAYALPLLSRARVPFDTVIELNPARAATVAKRFGFAHADTDAARGLRRLAAYEAPVLVIATYHSTHLDIAEQALSVNPATRIMLEKPPVTTLAQLDRLRALRRDGAYIEIGYNRRHTPMAVDARAIVESEPGPVVMTCIVKELEISPAHWYRWPAQGTRATGNLCHWLDLARYFIAAEPERMYVVNASRTQGDDSATIVVRYADGSRLHLVATEHGSALRGVQEFIEIRRGDLTLTIDDFLRFRVQQRATQSVSRRLVRDKGHGRMYARFIENVVAGRPVQYADRDLLLTTVQYLAASDALRSGAPVAETDLRALARRD